MIVLRRSLFDIRDLSLESFKSVTIHEVVVADSGSIVFRVITIPALEYWGVRAAWEVQWFRLQRVVVELVEVSLVRKRLVGPDAFQTLDELFAATITFAVVEPVFANACKLIQVSMSHMVTVSFSQKTV